MSGKITLDDASQRYRVTKRTIHRWIKDNSITQFEDGTYDGEQLDEGEAALGPEAAAVMCGDWGHHKGGGWI